MRLCYLANPNSIHTQRWVRYFVKQGHEVHLIGLPKLGENTTVSQDDFPKPLVFHGLEPPLQVRKLWYLPLAYQVRRLVHRIKPDVLHAHQVSPAGWLGAASGYHPLMVTAWGSDLLIKPTLSWVFRVLAGWVLRRADYVTCVSEQLVQRAQDLGADPTTLEMAPWGVDVSVFRPSKADAALRGDFDLRSGPVVLSLRPLRSVYNPLDIAQAIPEVVRRNPDVQFVIRTYSYEKDLLDQFQAIVHQHSINNAVNYVGDLPNDRAIANLYRIADIAVSVPSSDGTPLSVLEALACGAVPVISDLPSLRAWITDEVQGLFTPVGDVQAISHSILRLLTDEKLRRRLRDNGLALVRQHADSRVWMAHAEGLYEQLVERQ